VLFLCTAIGQSQSRSASRHSRTSSRHKRSNTFSTSSLDAREKLLQEKLECLQRIFEIESQCIQLDDSTFTDPPSYTSPSNISYEVSSAQPGCHLTSSPCDSQSPTRHREDPQYAATVGSCEFSTPMKFEHLQHGYQVESELPVADTPTPGCPIPSVPVQHSSAVMSYSPPPTIPAQPQSQLELPVAYQSTYSPTPGCPIPSVHVQHSSDMVLYPPPPTVPIQPQSQLELPVPDQSTYTPTPGCPIPSVHVQHSSTVISYPPPPTISAQPQSQLELPVPDQSTRIPAPVCVIPSFLLQHSSDMMLYPPPPPIPVQPPPHAMYPLRYEVPPPGTVLLPCQQPDSTFVRNVKTSRTTDEASFGISLTSAALGSSDISVGSGDIDYRIGHLSLPSLITSISANFTTANVSTVQSLSEGHVRTSLKTDNASMMSTELMWTGISVGSGDVDYRIGHLSCPSLTTSISADFTAASGSSVKDVTVLQLAASVSGVQGDIGAQLAATKLTSSRIR